MSFDYRIDMSRCVGCRACEVACVTANDLDPQGSRNRVPYLEADDSRRSHAAFAPYLCMHCEEPPCVDACPTGASYQAADGRVLVDVDRCIGCGLCVPACPYEARYVSEASNRLEKCTLCEGRVEAGLSPACFEVCPAGARHFEERRPDGAVVRVGAPDEPDEGHETTRLVPAEARPRPRLVFSGRPEDLRLLREKRRPRGGQAVPGALWRNGVGYLMQGLGVAAAFAMGGMLGLRKLQERKQALRDAGARDGGEGR